MTPRTRVVIAVLAAFLATGCGEHALEQPLVPDARPATRLAHLHATVDATSGTLTFDDRAGAGGVAAGPGVSAAIYGNQGVTVRIYNSTVVVGAPAGGKKTYTASVGLRNLLAYRIGDEQLAAAPPDTLGIYVFVNSPPVVAGTSSPCPACTVTVKNAHGQLNFTAPSQPYWFWPEILGPANGGADTTRLRKTWVFEADTQVTRFSFDVLVSAPWAPPNDTRFKVDYQGDSLPDTQSEPRWRVRNTGAGATWTATAGALALSTSNGQLGFYRRDSLGTTENAYIEARVRWNAAVAGNDQIQIGLDDGTRLIALAVYGTNVSFVNSAGTAIGTATTLTTTSAHTYQLRKYAADSAVFYVDGARSQWLAYGSFSANPYGATAPLALFGEQSFSLTPVASTVDYVTYELGAVLP
jgi:hypothetical protein